MFSRTWWFWMEKCRNTATTTATATIITNNNDTATTTTTTSTTTNYNVDSVKDAIINFDFPHKIIIFPASVLASDEPHSPPSWKQVRDQFHYVQGCASNSSGTKNDEEFVQIQRQAFITLWTLHTVNDWNNNNNKCAGRSSTSSSSSGEKRVHNNNNHHNH